MTPRQGSSSENILFFEKFDTAGFDPNFSFLLNRFGKFVLSFQKRFVIK